MKKERIKEQHEQLIFHNEHISNIMANYLNYEPSAPYQSKYSSQLYLGGQANRQLFFSNHCFHNKLKSEQQQKKSKEQQKRKLKDITNVHRQKNSQNSLKDYNDQKRKKYENLDIQDFNSQFRLQKILQIDSSIPLVPESISPQIQKINKHILNIQQLLNSSNKILNYNLAAEIYLERSRCIDSSLKAAIGNLFLNLHHKLNAMNLGINFLNSKIFHFVQQLIADQISCHQVVYDYKQMLNQTNQNSSKKDNQIQQLKEKLKIFERQSGKYREFANGIRFENGKLKEEIRSLKQVINQMNSQVDAAQRRQLIKSNEVCNLRDQVDALSIKLQESMLWNMIYQNVLKDKQTIGHLLEKNQQQLQKWKLRYFHECTSNRKFT